LEGVLGLVVAGALLLSGIGWLAAHYVLAGNSLIAGFEFAGAPHLHATFGKRDVRRIEM
jgi:hypothetical protein